MKRCWKIILVFLFFFVFWGNFAPAQEVQGPKLVLKEQVFDFKEVNEGEIVEHSFKVLNEGNQPLEIKKVRTG